MTHSCASHTTVPFDRLMMGHKIFVGSKVGEKSFPEVVLVGFFKVAVTTNPELASKMKLPEEPLDHPTVSSSFKLLHA